MNARFWTRVHGSWVKLTLREGDQVVHRESEPTEEGWRTVERDWTREGETIVHGECWRERDCDGVHSGASVASCHIARLKSRAAYAQDPDYCPEMGIGLPAWRVTDEMRRDHTAERAGY